MPSSTWRCARRGAARRASPDDPAWAQAVESVVRARDGLDCSLHVSNGRRAVAVAVVPRRSWS